MADLMRRVTRWISGDETGSWASHESEGMALEFVRSGTHSHTYPITFMANCASQEEFSCALKKAVASASECANG